MRWARVEKRSRVGAGMSWAGVGWGGVREMEVARPCGVDADVGYFSCVPSPVSSSSYYYHHHY